MAARKSTGSVVEGSSRRGVSWGIRFRAGGARRFQHVGYAAEGTTRADAERELAYVLEQVRPGDWAPAAEPQAPIESPTFHEFASAWYARREGEELRERTLDHLRWTLSDHLLPYFRDYRLDAITVEAVDQYVQAKVREGALGAGSINRTLVTLAAVMEVAVEYGHVERNPAVGRRRLPRTKPARPYLEPEQLAALLRAAGELDDEDRSGRRNRRPALATLAYAGLRVGELLALRWGDVDLASGRLYVRSSKTEAGIRAIDIQPELRDDLLGWKLSTRHSGAGDLVFGTSTGRPDARNNVRRRLLLRSLKRANERIAQEGGCAPLPDGLSPHALRRTFASWLVAEGEDPAYVMQQLGHTDPKMTLGLYAKALQSTRRRAHAGGREQESIGIEAPEGARGFGASPKRPQPTT